ncbi:MAG: signal peptide peptidase SppA [Bacteroidota bacterium]|nr:signal peptide peptidase SppA [Bacteroidota bacterium]
MRQFFKFMFASMLGVFLSIILLFFIFAIIVSAIVSSVSVDEKVKVTSGTILHMEFKAPLRDRSSENPFANLDFSSLSSGSQPGLNDIIKNIEKAADDNNISGIYLDLAGLQGGFAAIEEIRNALLEFKKSKKFIYAYSDYYSQSSYYLASVSDQVWMNPEGVVDLRGFSAQMPFMKGMFEKLEIEPQVIRHGKFKSAIEPLILEKMSDENREQVATYMNALWNHYISKVAVSRKIEATQLQTIADSVLSRTTEDALRLKLIDKSGYKDQFLSDLKSLSDKSAGDDLVMVTLKKYTRAPRSGTEKEFTRDKIAVIYASGNIVGGKGNSDEIGSESLSETIRKAREDEKVKAVVLRVNSPGGDALASEVIWREMDLCRKVKPVIVSMGDVAASGGYYISCAADTIIAQPNTITGSIGVFGVLFNVQKLFNNKLGITFDGYETAPFADLGTPFRALTEPEKQIIQQSVERVYTTFTTRVADGRNMPINNVDSIGQGRVWAGSDALRLGLVDMLGGLDDAIAVAAEKAQLDNYRISELPEQKDAFKQIMEEIAGDMETRWIKYKLGSNYNLFESYRSVSNLQGIQARSFVDFQLR